MSTERERATQQDGAERTHLPDVVKVAVRDALHLGHLAILVKQDVKVPLALEEAESTECERFRRAVRDDRENLVEVLKVFFDRRNRVERLLFVCLGVWRIYRFMG